MEYILKKLSIQGVYNLYFCTKKFQKGDIVYYSFYRRFGEYFSDSDLEDTCYVNFRNQITKQIDGHECVLSEVFKLVKAVPPELINTLEVDKEYDEDFVNSFNPAPNR